MNAEPVVAEQTFDAPVDVVWRAITEPGQMRQWFFEPMTEFEPAVGFETRFNVHAEGRDYLHLWKLTEVVPHEKIVCDWRYADTPGQSTVVWELAETDGRTTLKLTHTGIETFPQDNPVFSREATQGGWDYFIRESLAGFLSRGES